MTASAQSQHRRGWQGLVQVNSREAAVVAIFNATVVVGAPAAPAVAATLSAAIAAATGGSSTAPHSHSVGNRVPARLCDSLLWLDRL